MRSAERLYAPALQRDLQGYSGAEIIRSHWRETQGLHPLAQVQYADLKTYLPGDILTKVDRASMAHSLEVRVPLLDHDLVEWAATLPPRLRLNARGSKFVLKTALGPYLPPAILRRRKMGFAVPLAAWLRGSLLGPVERALAEPAFADAGLFDMAARPPPDRAAPERSQRSQPADLGPVHVRGLPCPGARARSGPADG